LPSYSLSVNNEVSGMLQQKTDRSGFIETEAFLELRRFAQDAMEWMAKRRMEMAQKRRAAARTEAPEKSRQARKTLEQAIANVPQKARAELKHAFNTYAGTKEKEVRGLRKEVQLYRTLSTAGITAATFAHESTGNPVKVITQSIKAIARRAQKELGARYDNLIRSPVDEIHKAAASLAVLGTATLRLLAHEKRRVGRVDIHDLLRELLKTFSPFIKGRDVSVELDLCDGRPFVHASEAALESIATNLLNNSLAALERSNASARRILICTLLIDGILILRVLDNGTGIEGIKKRDIWLPGQTTQVNGTGLGLAIVHDTVRDLGGTVDAIERGELGGAEIIIELPVIGA
jgi:C4-dicarboxylate-specific signal transduction histidine kinase